MSKLIGHSRNYISETLRIGASTEKQAEITGKIKQAVAVELVSRGVGISCDDEQKQNVRMLNMEVAQTKNDLAIANRDKNFMKKKLQDKNLIINLVYNPSGAFLPGSQSELEAEFKKKLWDRYQIRFNSLFTITNLPISRFLEYLLRSGNYENYMEKLISAFNPVAAAGVMCRNTLSIGWDGYLFDCDFNQMLDLKVDLLNHQHVSTWNSAALAKRAIVVNNHCFGCTAGAGSSCGGATA